MGHAGRSRADSDMIADLFSSLVGEWRGEGHGDYPTIADFKYRESLTFQRRDQESIFYLQRTEKRRVDQEEYVMSHWESGFIRQLEDGRLELANTQIGGRGELLIGRAQQNEGQIAVHFESRSINNDERMVATSRVFVLDGRRLHYEMKMHTTAVGELSHHLSATLERVGSDQYVTNVNLGEE